MFKLDIAAEADHAKIEELYMEAFPPEERIPYELMLASAGSQSAELLSMKDGFGLAGFAFVILHDDLAYLFFLAISGEKRGMGYGSLAMDALLRRYEGKRLFLVIEQPDDAADNAGQRIRRRNFYLRCGLCDLPFSISEDDMVYDAMGTDNVLKPEYLSLMEEWLGDEDAPFVTDYIER